MKSIMEHVLDKAKVLIHKKPFYGFFLSYIDKKVYTKEQAERLRVPTACVAPKPDMIGYVLRVNFGFWERLREHKRDALRDERIQLLMHEILHIIYHHPTMSGDFADKRLFNIAADMEINQICGSFGDGHDMTYAEYQQFLEDNAEKIKSGEIDAPIRTVHLEDFGFDPKEDAMKGTRYYYDKLREKEQNNEKNKDGDSISDMLSKYGRLTKNGVPFYGDHISWEEFGKLSEAARDMYDKQVDFQMNQIADAMSRGDVPGSIREMIEQRRLKPTVNWKNQLKGFMSKSQNFYTVGSRYKRNRRFPDFPGYKLKQKHKVLLAVDTSGSMSQRDLEECFSEIHHVWKAGVGVDIIECDAAFDKDEDMYEYRGRIPIDRKGLSGGGGTTFDQPIEYAVKHAHEYTCIIYLTDGYAPAPTTYKNVIPLLWLITSRSGLNRTELKEEGFPGMIIKMKHKED